MSLDLFPALNPVVAASVLYAPHQVDQTWERRARVRVEQARSEQYVPIPQQLTGCAGGRHNMPPPRAS